MINELEPAPGVDTGVDTGGIIRQSAQEVFSTMLGIDLEAGETIIDRAALSHQPGGVIALLGLTGEWAGSGQISCEPAFACRIASLMLMAEYEKVDDDVLDAIAEVANMIIGNVKNLLEPAMGPMGLSTPTIVFGGDFDTRIAGNPERVVVPFTSGDDVMSVQIVLAPKQPGLAGRDRLRHGVRASG